MKDFGFDFSRSVNLGISLFGLTKEFYLKKLHGFLNLDFHSSKFCFQIPFKKLSL